MNPAPLAGVGVLVTRPAHQADALCARIEAAGGRAIRFPALAILDAPDPAAAGAALAGLDSYDLAIFISPNAVDKAVALLAGRDWPGRVQRAALGAGTARALEKCGLPAQLVPATRFDSEALLELPALRDVTGRRIAIVRGVGGRALLGDTLRARGAHVDYIEVYRRSRPQADARDILRAWNQGAIDVVTVASPDALRNLAEMLGAAGRTLLLRTPLVVVSARMVQQALELGFTEPPHVADNASDEALVAALLSWRRNSGTGERE